MSETNPISDFPNYHKEITAKITKSVYWTEPKLRIMRLRLLTDPSFPFWDVSYCHGQLPSGEYVDVQLPFSQLHKSGSTINRQIVEFAKSDGVYAKSLGILDAISTFS